MVGVAHLAGHILSRVTQRLSADWQAKYGHPLYLLETFVQADRFTGTAYQAANWLRVVSVPAVNVALTSICSSP